MGYAQDAVLWTPAERFGSDIGDAFGDEDGFQGAAIGERAFIDVCKRVRENDFRYAHASFEGALTDVSHHYFGRHNWRTPCKQGSINADSKIVSEGESPHDES